VTSTDKRERPPLPRLVEQMRVLLWLQFFVTLLNTLPLFLFEWILQGREDDAFRAGGFDNPAYWFWSDRADLVGRLALAVLGTAVLLAICAGLTRQGWIVLYPLIIVAEAAVVASLVWLVLDSVYVGMGVTLALAFGGWALTDLFRGQTRRFIFRRRSRVPAVTPSPTSLVTPASPATAVTPASLATPPSAPIDAE
jgi:hypothetical protein